MSTPIFTMHDEKQRQTQPGKKDWHSIHNCWHISKIAFGTSCTHVLPWKFVMAPQGASWSSQKESVINISLVYAPEEKQMRNNYQGSGSTTVLARASLLWARSDTKFAKQHQRLMRLILTLWDNNKVSNKHQSKPSNQDLVHRNKHIYSSFSCVMTMHNKLC